MTVAYLTHGHFTKLLSMNCSNLGQVHTSPKVQVALELSLLRRAPVYKPLLGFKNGQSVASSVQGNKSTKSLPLPNMVAKFAGKRYKLASADNFETYLKHIGVSEDNIKLYLSVTPSLDIQIEGDTYNINTYSNLGNKKVSFKVGEEFLQKLIDGREVKTVFTIEGNKIIETHKEQPLESVVTREFSDDEVKITMRAGDVVATRTYKAE